MHESRAAVVVNKRQNDKQINVTNFYLQKAYRASFIDEAMNIWSIELTL